jgi:hypothetical protein
MVDDTSPLFSQLSITFAASIFAKPSQPNEGAPHNRGNCKEIVELSGCSTQLPEWIHYKTFYLWLAAPREDPCRTRATSPLAATFFFSSEPSLCPPAPGFSHVRNDSGDPSGLTYAMHQRDTSLKQNLKFATIQGVQGLAQPLPRV